MVPIQVCCNSQIDMKTLPSQRGLILIKPSGCDFLDQTEAPYLQKFALDGVHMPLLAASLNVLFPISPQVPLQSGWDNLQWLELTETS